MRMLTWIVLCTGILLGTPFALAGPPPPVSVAPPTPPAPPPRPPRGMHGRRRPGREPLKDKLFPPELIMGHQEDIGLSDAQRKAIVKEIESAQAKLTPLQWQVRAEADKLEALVLPPRVDEARALALADKVSVLERDLKRMHLSLLIRIKNLLSAEQQQKLQLLRGGGAAVADW